MKEQSIHALHLGDRVLGFFLVRHKQLEPFRDRT